MELLEAPAFTPYPSGYLTDDEYRELQSRLPRRRSWRRYARNGRISEGSLGRPKRGKGRRGGLRVIYYYFSGEQQIWLITLYDKDEASDLTPKEKQALKSAIETELRARQSAKLAKQRKSKR